MSTIRSMTVRVMAGTSIATVLMAGLVHSENGIPSNPMSLACSGMRMPCSISSCNAPIAIGIGQTRDAAFWGWRCSLELAIKQSPRSLAPAFECAFAINALVRRNRDAMPIQRLQNCGQSSRTEAVAIAVPLDVLLIRVWRSQYKEAPAASLP